jgi:hypothetical protein
LVWWSLPEGSVWSVSVEWSVLVDDEAEVVLSGDQDAVGCLTAARSDPALRDGVHSRYCGLGDPGTGRVSGDAGDV